MVGKTRGESRSRRGCFGSFGVEAVGKTDWGRVEVGERAVDARQEFSPVGWTPLDSGSNLTRGVGGGSGSKARGMIAAASELDHGLVNR